MRILGAAQMVSASEYARRYLALHLALRQTETLGLAWDDIDFDGKQINIRFALGVTRSGKVREALKTTNARRPLTLGEGTASALRAVRAEQDEWRALHDCADGEFNPHDLVFVSRTGQHFHPRNDYTAWQRTLRRAGVARWRLHDCRHTAATAMVDSGIEPSKVSRFLGHATTSFTMNTYVHHTALDAGDVDGTLVARYAAQSPSTSLPD